MCRINSSYFRSRARLDFRWIFKEFDLKSNMKGFFENFLALSVKKLKKVSSVTLLGSKVLTLIKYVSATKLGTGIHLFRKR